MRIQRASITYVAIVLMVSMVLVSLAAFVPRGVRAAPNPQVNYQGKLTDASNLAVPDGTYNMRFWLLTSPTIATTSALWSESLTGANRVTVTNGLFSIMLGSTSPLTSVDFNQTLYLGVEIGGTGTPAWDGEMSPRKILGTVPAAFVAETLDGLNSTQFVRTDATSSIATSSADTLLSITQNGAGDILNLFDGGTEVFSVLDGGNVGVGTSSPIARFAVAGASYFGGSLTATGTITAPSISISSSSTLGNASSTALTVANNAYLNTFTATAGTTTAASSTNLFATTFRATTASTSYASTTGLTAQNAYLASLVFGATPGVLATNGSGVVSASTTIGDSYIADGLTISGGTLGSNTIAGGSTWTTSNGLTISGTTTITYASTTGLTAQNAVVTNANITNATTTALGINGESFTDLTGSGLTISGNALTCATASGAQFGCLSTADWTSFNGKVSSTSIDTSSELAALLTDETGTGNVVFSASPVFTGTPTFQNLYVAPTGTTTLGFASSTALTVANNAYLNTFTATAGTTTAASSTNLFATTFTATNGTIASLLGTNATITNATATSLFSTTGTFTNLFGTNETVTNSTITNALITNGTTTAASSTNLFATNLRATNAVATNATTTALAITGITGTTQCLQVTATGVVVGTGTACGSGSLGGTGTDGYVARWTGASTLGTGVFRDSGTVGGVNATTSTSTFLVQGSGGVNPFAVASSTGAILMNVLQNGNVGIGSTTPSRLLTVGGDAYFQSNITAASSTLGAATSSSFAITGQVSGVLTALASGAVVSSTTIGDSYIADGLTISGGTLGSNTIAGGSTWTTSNGLTISGTTTITYASTTGLTAQNAVVTNANITNATTTALGINGESFTDLTGSGLTISGNALTCATASGAQFGCLSTADWTSFNGKVSSTSIDTSSELAALLTDETGTGNVVFSASPVFTGTPTFQNLYVAPTGTTTLGFASSTALTVANNAYLNTFTATAGTTTAASSTNLFATTFTATNGTIASLLATNGTTTNASSTNLFATNGFFTNLKINALRDSANSLGTNGQILQTNGSTASWVSTSTLGFGQSNWLFNGSRLSPSTTVGIGVFASSTIGGGTGATGLTIAGNSTTTLNSYIGGTLSIGTTTQNEKLRISGGDLGVYENDFYVTGNTGNEELSLSYIPSGTTVFSAKTQGGVIITGTNDFANNDLLKIRTVSGSTGDALRITNQNENVPDYLSVSSVGKVGIGSSTPTAKLTLHANAGETNQQLFTVASSTTSGTTTLFSILASGQTVINTASSTNASTTRLSLYGSLFDTNSNVGTKGMVLLSTGTSTLWTATSSLGITGGSSNWVDNGAYLSTLGAGDGIIVSGSSTIGGGTGATGLTILGTATTTNLKVTSLTPSRALFTASDGLFTTTGTSQFLSDAISDEVGTGNAVFNTSPYFLGTAGFVNATTSGSLSLGTSTLSTRLTVWGSDTSGTTRLANFVNSASTTLLTIMNDGKVGIGTTTPEEKLTVYGGSFAVRGSSGSEGIGVYNPDVGAYAFAADTNGQAYIGEINGFPNGQGLQISPRGGTAWVPLQIDRDQNDSGVMFIVDNVGKVGIGSSTPTGLLSITNTRSTTANTPLFTVASTTGGTATSSLFAILANGRIGIGSTTPESESLTIQRTGLSTSTIAGVKQYLGFTSASGTVAYGDNMYILSQPTGTSTLVGDIIRIEDNSTYGNTVRGLEVQAQRGTNTKGENTALSGFGRTFGVRGVTEGDAGDTLVPAGVFAQTRGTTQGNALRAYSGTITTTSLVQLFHDTSAFSGTGLLMNFGNSGGSFAATSSAKFIDLQNAGVSKFTVTAGGTTTIGDGTTGTMAGLQIGYGGLCVDNDGSCTATTTGRITAVQYGTANSDLAEMYFSSQNLLTGEIVALSGGLSVRRAEEETEDRIIGVVSTKPGLVMGSDDSSLISGEVAHPVALKGRVPIRLSTENGPIKKGDRIALSSIPGVGMKATESGTVVGIALEDFDGTKAYSAGYLNQFGDDLVKAKLQPRYVNTDTRTQDGCSYGGGNESGTSTCVKEKVDPIKVETITVDERTGVLNELRTTPPEVAETDDGTEVSIGQVIMFVGLTHYTVENEASILTALSATTTSGDGEETLFDRIKALAENFIDGVLRVTGIKTDELCVGDVCVDEAKFLEMVESAQGEGTHGGGGNDEEVDTPPDTDDGAGGEGEESDGDGGIEEESPPPVENGEGEEGGGDEGGQAVDSGDSEEEGIAEGSEESETLSEPTSAPEGEVAGEGEEGDEVGDGSTGANTVEDEGTGSVSGGQE